MLRPASRRGIGRARRSEVLKQATVRDFSGGWNTVDNGLNLDTRFAVILDNMSREEDGSNGVRWGTELFSDLHAASAFPEGAHIINSYAFQNSVVTVCSDGRIFRTDAVGTSAVVWDTTIASGLIGSPAAWGPTDFASFAVFNGKLLVCNGTDKPLIVDFLNATPVQYLADEGTGSNVNTPICRYVLATDSYVIMAGDPLFPDRLHISARNTSGTWFGDPAPNSAVQIDLGKQGISDDQTITGLSQYRTQVVVGFFNASILGTLDIYNSDDIHTPDFGDVLHEYGCHSHRSMVNLGNDLFFLDDQGVVSVARSRVSAQTDPKRSSEFIDPTITENINRLIDEDLLLRTHAVYNSNDKQYMCFVPNHAGIAQSMEDDPFEVFGQSTTTLLVRVRAHRFSVGDQFEITGATAFNLLVPGDLNTTHTVARVINEDIIEINLPDGTIIDLNSDLYGGGDSVMITPLWTETYGYVYTFVNELRVRAWSRFRNWRWRASTRTKEGDIVFADDTRLFLYGKATRPAYQDFIGTDDVQNIEYIWEFPWADFDTRGRTKNFKYLQMDTTGNGEFYLLMFLDEVYKRAGQLVPNNIMQITAGGRGGFGNDPITFGGGRRTSDARLFAWPGRGKLAKLRIQGSTDRPIRIVSITLMYTLGSIRS